MTFPGPGRGGTACIVQQSAAPPGLGTVFPEVARYKYGAPTELAVRCGLGGDRKPQRSDPAADDV